MPLRRLEPLARRLDQATGEVLDNRTRKGVADAASSDATSEYDQLEVDAYRVSKLPGIQESGLNPKSISKIEYLDPVTKEQVCTPLTDPKIISHHC